MLAIWHFSVIAVARNAERDADSVASSPEEAEEPAEGDEPVEGEGEEEEKDDDEPFAADETEQVEAPVAASSKTDTASARRTVASRAARKAVKQDAPKPAAPGIKMAAAADVPGFPSGTEFSSLAEAGKAIMKRIDGLPKTGKQVVRTGAVVFNMPKTEFSQDNWRGRDSEMLLTAASESRLEGGSLVAAGGWGAPSETILDFCKIETTEGLIQLPEVTITRGGVNYTKGPVFADVFNSANGFWDMDEATAEAGTELKTSYRPEVPGFIEERLDAVGVMMEAGLLTRAGWPELVDRYAELGLTAHQHKIARKVVNLIREFTGAAIGAPNGYGNALDVLHILEVVATGERERNVMSLSATLEVLLPHWMRNVIRVDLANRTGVENFLNVSDAQINAFFTARNLRVQWLYDYQNLTPDASGLVTAYPTTVDAIMYPAGTYVKGVADVMNHRITTVTAAAFSGVSTAAVLLAGANRCRSFSYQIAQNTDAAWCIA